MFRSQAARWLHGRDLHILCRRGVDTDWPIKATSYRLEDGSVFTPDLTGIPRRSVIYHF